jgi:hypothetical protein
MRTIKSLAGALIMAMCTALLLSTTLGIDLMPTFAALMGLSLLIGVIGSNPKHQRAKGMAMAGLLQEVWLGDLLGRFWDRNDYLDDAKPWDAFVDADAINLAEIGASPNVVKNRSVYPVPVSQRTDTALRITLDDYSSDSTVVRDVEAISLDYDKRKSVVEDHKVSIFQKIADDGIYNIAPTANTINTPVVRTSGAVSTISGYKTLLTADITSLTIAFDNLKYPTVGRTLLVPPTMFWEFVSTNDILKAQAQFTGKGGTATDTWVYFMGWIIKSRATTAFYNFGTLAKIAPGAVPNATTDGQACVAYVAKQSFGKALGTAQMYAKLKDPDNQGDVINFRLRALVMPVRQRILGAIVASK